MSKVFIGFKTDPRMRDRLFQRADADSCSRSQIIRAALSQYLELEATPVSEKASRLETFSKSLPEGALRNGNRNTT